MATAQGGERDTKPYSLWLLSDTRPMSPAIVLWQHGLGLENCVCTEPPQFCMV